MPAPISDVSRLIPAGRASDATRPDVAAHIAARQHGVVSTVQLVEGGMSTSAISRHARSGRLVRKYVGVYAVGHDRLTARGEWMAAVLAGGPGAVLSHRSAALAWDLLDDGRSAIDITVVNRRGFGQRRLTPHECQLRPHDTTTLDGIPITTVARTLLDLAEVVPYRRFQRAAEQSLILRRFDLRAMHETLDAAIGRRGVRPLRRFLAEVVDEPALKRSTLERLAIELVARHALPRPVVNAPLLGKEIDLLWPHERVAAELDSWRFHGTRLVFERDRDRDAMLQAQGYAVLRFTWRQITQQPSVVASRIRAVLDGRVASGSR